MGWELAISRQGKANVRRAEHVVLGSTAQASRSARRPTARDGTDRAAELGAKANNGVVGVAVTVVLIALLGLAFTGIFYLVAIRAKDPQTPFTMQPLGLPFAFLSSALVPIAIMPGWSAAIARANPVSVVVDAARNAMIGDLWSSDLGAATAILVGWSLVAVTITTAVLARELRGAR